MRGWNESITNTEGGPMDTLGNTAAIYVRRSAADDRIAAFNANRDNA
tara:strand:- start:6472 stop:6612 length:141 start_codon:yes stop_codon:yes gene_type:complete